MKGLFVITIGQDEKSGLFGATVVSMADGMSNKCSSPRFATLINTLSTRIKKRALHDRKFPPPEPSKIIKPNGFQAPRLIATGGAN